MSSVLGVIPARYASTRFPGKPLANILGRPMIQWVVEAASKALSDVVVATDDRRIELAVKNFGGKVLMTPRSCSTGTERVAYVAKKRRADYYVNVQGDEPLIHKKTIQFAVDMSKRYRSIATCATNLKSDEGLNPNVVKVVLGKDSRALYFSRSLVPFPRDSGSPLKPLKHLGLYVYPRRDLLAFVKLKPTHLENTEMLEQLRALYHGMPIYVAQTSHASVGVDTPQDLKRVIANIKSSSRLSPG